MKRRPHVLFLNDRHQANVLVGAGLLEQAFTSSWLVLSRRSAPHGGHVHVVPYPRRSDLASPGKRFTGIERSDPWVQYYGGNANHYRYYHQQIVALIRSLQPNLVVGGKAHFHQLLCIDVCRELGVPYVSPVPVGDLPGRLAYHCGNSVETVAGSGYIPQRSEVMDYISRHSSCDMQLDAIDARIPHSHSLSKQILGEQFCVPPLVKRLADQRRRRRNLDRWNEASKTVAFPMVPHKKLKILFPLQLQPEATMDVWGVNYRDQAILLQRLATAAGDQASIFLKLHPQANCEMTSTLLEVVARNPALLPLSSRVRMRDAFAYADLVLTVTGAVALQAVLARKPCATLVPSRNNGARGCRYLRSPEKLAPLLYEMQSGCFSMHGPEDLAKFVEQLFADSYEGFIPPRGTSLAVASIEQGKRMVAALGHLVARVAVPSDSLSLIEHTQIHAAPQKVKA